MKKNITIFFLLGLLSCCMAAFILWRAYSKYIGDPYDDFTRDANLAVPLLIQMDEDTHSQFPVPPQAREKKHSYSNEIDKPNLPVIIYGNMLEVKYKYTGNSEDILAYYKELLTQQGWNEQETSATGLFYIKETACFELSVGTSSYTIEIRHDFWKQDFGPKPGPYFPGTKILLWNLLIPEDYIPIYTCP